MGHVRPGATGVHFSSAWQVQSRCRTATVVIAVRDRPQAGNVWVAAGRWGEVGVGGKLWGMGAVWQTRRRSSVHGSSIPCGAASPAQRAPAASSPRTGCEARHDHQRWRVWHRRSRPQRPPSPAGPARPTGWRRAASAASGRGGDGGRQTGRLRSRLAACVPAVCRQPAVDGEQRFSGIMTEHTRRLCTAVHACAAGRREHE